ncbi:AAA domain-containing protein [Paenibacillus residui]|uniref:AAA domain-containing protein n=1 Tax=Paenibacillus residui TaxID=629724 RepID=A0ABW3DFC3_9BACL
MDRYTRLLFEREVGALRRLHHNHIIQMYDFEFLPGENGGKKGRIFLEHISGENLQTIDRSLIEYVDKIRIIQQLIDAVEAAHSQAILHRDIKPSNIMIVEHRQAKLIDFGLSKIKGMVTGETIYKFGSNHYSAPEVGYHPENASFQSDIYSLGATIYFFLTGCVPDLPENLKVSISQSSDITPPLKNILMKAVETDLKARYETITDLKRDLAQIIDSLLSVTKFSIKFPLELLEKARSLRFVPRYVKLNEFIDQFLNKWFEKDIYGFVDSKLESGRLENGDEVSFFSTDGYLLKGVYQDYDEHFLVNDIKFLKQTERSRYEKMYLRIAGKPIFNHSMNQSTQMDFQTYEVVNDLVDHRIDYQSDASKQTEFEKFFGIWLDYLDKEKDLLISAAKSLDYMRYRYNTEDQTVEFELLDTTVESLGFTNETTIIFDPRLEDPDRKYRTKPVVIGKFKEITYQDDTVYLVVKSPNKINGIPRSGKLVEDYRFKINLLDKQMSAIRALKNDEAMCNENLRDIILGFETPKSIGSFNNINFFNERLDSNQKDSVKVALNTSSIAVIQGPPGTGKTTVIREFVNQILNRNNVDISQEKFKILIVSQSHTAVDNVLEGLHFPQDFSTKVIRIGLDENILPAIRDKYSVSNARNLWANETKQASCRKMKNLATQYEIDPDELKQYVEMKSQPSHSEEEELLIQQFESKYMGEPEKQRIIRTAIIQNNWINRLGIANDTESRLIENATIVAGTCTGFNSNPSTRNMNFDYVIVDEGAKASVPELLIPLLKGSRLILVGDHQQLPPVLNTEAIKLTSHGKQEDFENGMFKRLYDNFPKSNRIRLTTQYRMHRTIGDMISRVFYGNEIQTGIPNDERTHELELYQGKQLIWVSTSKVWNRRERRHQTHQDQKTYKNEKEIQIIKQKLWDIDKEEAARGYEIAVITGYSYQKSIIRDFVARADFKNICNIEVNTVDAYQGKDKDIVIFSTVRSNTKNDIGFQKSAQRINVALSRARRLLVIVGDKDHFMRNRQPTNKLPEIVRYMSQTDGCEIIEYKEPGHARK